MPYRTIVALIRDAEADAAALSAAVALAETHGAHLSVACFGIDRTNPGAYYAGAAAIALDRTLAEAQAEARACEAAVTERLRSMVSPWDTTSITAQIGALGPTVADRAELADLVVVPQPYGEGRGPEDEVIIEAALFRTRVPVLVVPAGCGGALAPKRISVAWNNHPEALAAIRGALPFLRAAGQADIIIVDPPAHAPDRSDPGGRLAEMLSRHGVKSDIAVLARTMPRISDILLRQAADREAGMLVMGAYGHSRLREAILGGATRNILQDATLPVLMAH